MGIEGELYPRSGEKEGIVFLGASTLNLDAKGRMAVPAKHRDALASCGARVIVTVNPRERCLWLYPEDEWQEVARQLVRLPTMNKQNRDLQRLLLGHAAELEMDGQGRILLSSELREYAGLSKKVSLLGAGLKFEIWDEVSYAKNLEDCLAEAADTDSALSAELAEMVF